MPALRTRTAGKGTSIPTAVLGFRPSRNRGITQEPSLERCPEQWPSNVELSDLWISASSKGAARALSLLPFQTRTRTAPRYEYTTNHAARFTGQRNSRSTPRQAWNVRNVPRPTNEVATVTGLKWRGCGLQALLAYCRSCSNSKAQEASRSADDQPPD